MNLRRLSKALSLGLALSCAVAEAGELSGESQELSGADAAWCSATLAIPSAPITQASIEAAPAHVSAPAATKESRELVMSLSLSGGGYRAMLFHVGTLRRLNDAGILPRLAVISSVSGGSVASAYLAYRWKDLTFDDTDRASNFVEVIEKPLREMAGTTLDIPSVLIGLLPFTSAADRQVARFDEWLFHGALLSEIAAGGPAVGAARPRPLSSSTRPACRRANCGSSALPRWAALSPAGSSRARRGSRRRWPRPLVSPRSFAVGAAPGRRGQRRTLAQLRGLPRQPLRRRLR